MYIINVINIRLFVYSIFIFSPRYIRFCFAHFWARSKSSKYLQQKHGVMAVKRKMIHNLVMREIFVSRAGELSHAGDRPKYWEPPAQVVRVNRYVLSIWLRTRQIFKIFIIYMSIKSPSIKPNQVTSDLFWGSRGSIDPWHYSWSRHAASCSSSQQSRWTHLPTIYTKQKKICTMNV